VNLATERLDLQVMPHTKGLRIFSLRSPLYMRGSLGSPDVGVEKGPLLVRSTEAAALAAVAAPAAVAALLDSSPPAMTTMASTPARACSNCCAVRGH
jgi:uncharacterized protein involved in outer membrane biogenesis